MELNGREITVVGAGVAGLAAALALSRQGARVTVLEQAEAVREFGAGFQITPNGARVLRAVRRVLAETDVRTADLGGTSTTAEVTAALLDAVRQDAARPVAGAGA